MSKYNPAFLKRIQPIDLVNDRMPPATIGFALGVLFIEVTVFTSYQPAELFLQEEQRKDIAKA